MEVLFNPTEHTHTSCLKEIKHCDIAVLIIGSRFGGDGIPELIDEVDFKKIQETSRASKNSNIADRYSITQFEILKAIECGIPVYSFIQSDVMSDHHVYELNKKDKGSDRIKYPSMDKQENAAYIFEFINFLRKRTEGNAVVSFSKVDEIHEYLSKQWSALLQNLLSSQRNNEIESKRYQSVESQIQDLKVAILGSIQNDDLRDTAKGAIQYRSVIEFLMSFKHDNVESLILSKKSWDEVLVVLRITKILIEDNDKGLFGRRTVFVIGDEGYYRAIAPFSIGKGMKKDWSEFINLPDKSRKAILDAILEIPSSRYSLIEYHEGKYFDDSRQETIDFEEIPNYFENTSNN